MTTKVHTASARHVGNQIARWRHRHNKPVFYYDFLITNIYIHIQTLSLHLAPSTLLPKSQKATIITNKNEATIDFPSGWAKNLVAEVKSNSSTEQLVQLKIDGDTTKSVKGCGEQNSIETFPLKEGIKKLVATFNYGDKGSSEKDMKPSELHQGGPWDIGVMKLLMVLAENGDDEDFNDVVLQIRGIGGK